MGRVENVKVRVLPAIAVVLREADGPDGKLWVDIPGKGIIVLQVDDQDTKTVREWLKDWYKQEGWKETSAAIDLRKWYRKKTQDQLALFWSLVTLLALDEEGSRDPEVVQSYYHGLLHLYAPRVVARLPNGTETESIKTMSEMTTVEASMVIEGAFRELAMKGINVKDNAIKIRAYYLEWRTWRGKLKIDGMEGTYKDLDDYRARVPFCEADPAHNMTDGGHLAHIISRGSGGENLETWNFLHLCPQCHIGLQHTKGWVEFLELHPHLIGKVNAARQWHGMPRIKEPEDLYSDLVEESTERNVTPDEAPLTKLGEDSGKRRMWFHPESESWVVDREMPDPLCAEVAVVETDDELRFLLTDLVSDKKLNIEEAREIADQEGCEWSPDDPPII